MGVAGCPRAGSAGEGGLTILVLLEPIDVDDWMDLELLRQAQFVCIASSRAFDRERDDVLGRELGGDEVTVAPHLQMLGREETLFSDVERDVSALFIGVMPLPLLYMCLGPVLLRKEAGERMVAMVQTARRQQPPPPV